jgi:hypothetical protein
MARRSGFWFIALIHFATLGIWAEASQPQSLEVYVYNRAGVSDKIISEAEEDATGIFWRSGFKTIWINCSIGGIGGTNCVGLPKPDSVILQIVHETTKLKDDVFGAAFVGRDGKGQYTDVYFDRVGELHRDWKVAIASVLGHVMAHEIGHLLLGLNSHSNSGIMRGLWNGEELEAAERGRLLFSSQQSRAMRDRLMRMARSTLASIAVESSGTP